MTTEPTGGSTAGSTLRTFWERIGEADWNGMAALLAPELRARYVHTGEVFTATEFDAVNREYPGTWRVTVHDVVASGDRAVSRASLTGGGETYHVATFGTVRDGRIVDLVEVWTDEVAAPPADRRPG